MKKELVIEIIQKRWSPYSFSPEKIDEYKLKTMMEAAGYAPSSVNEQPWLFIYTTRDNMEIFNDYIGFLDPSNQVWAKNAYSLIISMARMKYSKNGRMNRFALYDTGMAVANLILQAYVMDIYVHQMGGFSVENVKKYFNLDRDIEPVAVMAAGYLGEHNILPPELKVRDEVRRPRKPVNEYVYKDIMFNKAFCH